MALEIITADVLSPLRHGFFTRKGGASSGVYGALNCGLGSSDQTGVVAINRSRVAQAMGGSDATLVSLNQTHTATAVLVDAPQESGATRPEADAVVTATPGLVLMILTADCAPVLFADHEAGVIGAAHAGWRGAVDGVLQATVECMVSAGASRDRICAVVGPTISQTAYEVGPEFRDRFLQEDPANARFFTKGVGEKHQFDLPAFACNALRNNGISHVEWSRHCTYADPERFYSFRRSCHRNEPDYGRLASAISL